MKKQAVLIVSLIIIILIVIVGYTKVQSLFSEPSTTPSPTVVIEEELKKLDESEVIAEVNISFNKQAAIIKATKLPEDVQTINYELIYESDAKTGEPKASGINGSVSNYTAGDKTFLTQATLGTCSKSVCVYDINPRNFKLKLILKMANGEKVAWEKTF